jgi:hypothetical protein
MDRLARLESAPWAGIFSLCVVFMGLALGHSLLVFQRHFTGVPSGLDTGVSMVIGALGMYLVWRGLKLEENPATWHGYVGGILIWVGWFEWTWEYFGHWLGVQWVNDGEIGILSPGLQMIQATGLVVVLLLMLFGANKDTRCRMFMWFHRNLKLKPGQMTAGYKRQHARNTALETIFLTWFIYLCAIFINDPRVIGYDSTAAMAITVGFVAWGLYLVPKLAKMRGLGPALRYAIPTGNILWLPTEAFARWGLYPEIWVKPLKYSLTMTCVLVAFAVAGGMILRSRGLQGAQGSPA